MTDLARIRAYCSRATPGPWISQPLADDAGYLGYLVVTEDDAPETVEAVAECGFDRPGTNAEFIAQARTDLPALVAELEALREAARDGLWWLDAWLDATEDEPDEPQRIKLEAAVAPLRALLAGGDDG